jgi:23S rRNA pseudouridine1911/1915/1917 synthase
VAVVSLDILFEDNHCIAVNKPAGIASAHFQGGADTMDQVVKRYLKTKHQKPGNVFLGVVHRLDKPVSGVLLFARTSKAAARLSEQFRMGSVRKAYWAVVEGEFKPLSCMLRDSLRVDHNARRVHIVSPAAADARAAELHCRVIVVRDGLTLLELQPRTGRKHQIRVQVAHRGHPVYGDTKYGSRHVLGPAIALHARSLTFRHPIRHEPITFIANAPGCWRTAFPFLQIL